MPERQVSAYFRWGAGDYDRVSGPRADAAKPVLERLRIADGERVLDLGCGTGRITCAIAASIPRGRVTGVDLSEGMLAEARGRAAQDALRNVSFICGDLLALRCRGTFHVVFSNSALQWVRDQQAVAHILYGSLRPGGRIGLQFPGKEFCPQFLECVNAAILELGLEAHFRCWQHPWHLADAEGYDRLLREAGFVGREVFHKVVPVAFDTGDQVAEYFQAAGLRPYLAQIPAERHEEFRSAFGRGILPGPDGKITVSLRRLYAFASKPASRVPTGFRHLMRPYRRKDAETREATRWNGRDSA